MTTAQQDRAFIADIISASLLEEAIDWIASNLNPDDVFPDSDLEEWAERNGYELPFLGP
jgi:hypothetical protein